MNIPRTTTAVTKLDTADDITTSAGAINSDGKVLPSEVESVLRFSARLAKTMES